MGEAYQCRHFQPPWSFTSTQEPRRISPFVILTPWALQSVSVQPARLFLDTSAKHDQHSIRT